MLLSATDAQFNSQFSYEKVRAKYPSLYSILEPIQGKITNWDLLGQIFEKAIMQNECRQKPLNQNFIEVSFVATVVMRVPLKDSAQVILELYPPNIMGDTSSEENFRVIDLINAKIVPFFQEIKNQHLNFGNKTAEEFAEYEIAEETNKAAFLCLQQYQDIKNSTNRGNQMQPTPSSQRQPVPLTSVENIDIRERRALAAERRAAGNSSIELIEPIEERGSRTGIDVAGRKIEQLFARSDEMEDMTSEQKVAILMNRIKELEKVEARQKAEIKNQASVIRDLTTEIDKAISLQEGLTAERDGLQTAVKTMSGNEKVMREKLKTAEDRINILLGIVIGVTVVAAGVAFGPRIIVSITEFFKGKS